MGILTIKDIDYFWDFPSHLFLDFYQKCKLKYYQSINEANIAVAKMNTNLLLFFSSFGSKGKEADQAKLFKQSLPFDPDIIDSQLNSKCDIVSGETIEILGYYYEQNLLPQEVIKGFENDPEFKEVLIQSIRNRRR